MRSNLLISLRPLLASRTVNTRLLSMTPALPNVKRSTLGHAEVYDEQPMKEGKWIGVQELKVRPYTAMGGVEPNCEVVANLNWASPNMVSSPPPPLPQWRDEDGKDRKWEVAVRKTTGSGGIDGRPPPPRLTPTLHTPGHPRHSRRDRCTPASPFQATLDPNHPSVSPPGQGHLRRAARWADRRR